MIAITLHPITDGEWQLVLGAESFANGDRPLFASGKFASGTEYELVIGSEAADVLFWCGDEPICYARPFADGQYTSAQQALDLFAELIGEWPAEAGLGLEFFVLNGFERIN